MSGPLLKLLNTVRLLACRRLPGLVLAGLDDRRTFSGRKGAKVNNYPAGPKTHGQEIENNPQVVMTSRLADGGPESI